MKNYEGASALTMHGLTTSLIYNLPIPLIFALYPKLLMIVGESGDAEVESELNYLVPIIAVGIVADSLRYNLLEQLIILRDRKISSFLSFLGLSTGMALGGALALKTEVGISGVAAGYTLGASLAGLFLGLRIKNKRSPAQIEGHMKNIPKQAISGNKSCLFGDSERNSIKNSSKVQTYSYGI